MIPELLNPFGASGRDDPPRLPHSLLPGRVSPIKRLDFWHVNHQLAYQLAPYEATHRVSLMQRASWGTLLYWEQLFDSVPKWPDPDAPKPRIRIEPDREMVTV